MNVQTRSGRIGMKKFTYLLLFLLLLSIGTPVYARNSDKIVDQANLLTDEEEEKLEAQFAAIAETYQCDISVVTTNTLNGKSPMNYTDDYYYEHGYGYGEEISGIMLMVSMEDRDWWMATRGDAIRIFTDYGLEKLEDVFLDFLSDGEYYRAFQSFGAGAEDFMQEAKEGKPYDVDHTYKKPMSMGVRLLISLGVAVVLTAAILAVLFAQLASVKVKNEARDYVRSGSFRVTQARDLFLYRTVTRRKIEQETSGGGSSTHSAPGGGSAGGRGGKF